MPLSKRILPHGKKSINATSPNYYTATGTLDGNNILTGTTNSGSKTWTANLSALAGGGGVTSPLTTKGDIWVFGTANTRLAVGSNGQVLKADSGEALGLKWAAPTDTPAGSNQEIQYNADGSFGAIATLKYDGSNINQTAGNFNLIPGVGNSSMNITGSLNVSGTGGDNIVLRNDDATSPKTVLIRNDDDNATIRWQPKSGGAPTYTTTSGNFWAVGPSHTIGNNEHLVYDLGNERLGVGVDAPAYTLDVGSGYANAARLYLNEANNYIMGESDNMYLRAHNDMYFNIDTPGDSVLRHFIWRANTSSELMRLGEDGIFEIKSGGKVGIGTDAPNYPLHVMQGGNTYGMYMFNNGSKGIYFGDTNDNGTGFGKIGGVGGSLFLGSTQVYTSFIPTSDSSANLGQSNRRWSYSFFRYGQFGYSDQADENSGSGGYVLGVSGNANRHPFMVKAYGDEGVPSFIVTSGSNVGVGLAAPDKKFVIRTGGTRDFKFFDYDMTYESSLGIRAKNGGYLGLVTEGANSVFISTNGFANKRLVVDSAGLVGIGTTLPESKLHINGGAYLAQFSRGTGDFTLIQSNDTNNLIFAAGTPASNTEMMTIDSTGVGIGTTTPDKILHIHGGTDTAFKISNDGTGQGGSDGFEILQANGGDITLKNRESAALKFDTAGTNAMTIDSSQVTTFTNTPAVGTMTSSDNSTKAASTAYVTTAVAAAGGGDVSKSGTPVDNQLAIWTGANTIEGSADLTFDGSTIIADADVRIKNGEKLLLGTDSIFQIYGDAGSTKYITTIEEQLLIWNQDSSAAPIKIQATDTSNGIQFNIAGTEHGRFSSTGLGIGNTTALNSAKLTVLDSTRQLVLAHDGSNYFNFAADGDYLNITANSTNKTIMKLRDNGNVYFNGDNIIFEQPNEKYFQFKGTNKLTFGSEPAWAINDQSDTLTINREDGSGAVVIPAGPVGIGLVAPNTLRQGEGLTISGTAITNTAWSSTDIQRKPTSLFIPSLGSGSYQLVGVGGKSSQMASGRAEPPYMTIGASEQTILHENAMGGGRAVSLVLAGTAGYNSGGPDYGNFGSLLFHGNSNWSGNARRWLISNAWRNSGAGDMGLGFAGGVGAASLDPTVSGSTPSVVFSTDSNYGTSGKGGLLVGNTTHIATGKVTVVDADNGVPLTLAWDGSNYTTFSMDNSNNTVIQAHQGTLALKTDTGGKTIRLDSKGDVMLDLGGNSGTYLMKVVDSSANWLFTVHDSGTTAIHSGSLQIKEDVNAPAQVTAYGQLWVSGSTPNTLYFRNDAGADTQLGAGGGSAAGSDTQVQFNDGGSSFGGDAGLTYVKGTDTLTVASNININANLISGSSGHLQLYAADNVNLNSEAGITNFNYRGAETFRIAAGASSPVTLQPKASGYDLVLAAQDGTAVLHLDSTDKRIGIGTTNPSAKFSITNAASQWAAYVDQNNTGNLAMKIEGTYGLGIETSGQFPLDISTASSADALRMLDNGNLGIGTVTPEGVLHTANNSGVNIFQRSNDSASYGTNLYVRKSRGTVGSESNTQSGDLIGQMAFSPYYGDYDNYAAAISSAIEGTVTTDTTPGRLMFSTAAAGANTVTERMRIDSDGDVGIGTTNPSYALDVYKDTNSFVGRLKNTSSNGYVLRLEASDSTLDFQTDHIIYSYNMHMGDDSRNLYLRTLGKKLGVGTSSPATAFHVSGTNIVSRFQDTTGVAFTDIKRIGVDDTYAAVLAGNAGQALGTTADANSDLWVNGARYFRFRHATGSTTDGATTYMSGSVASSSFLEIKTTGNNYSKGALIEGPNELYIRTAGKDLSLDSGNNLTTHYDKEYVIYNDTGNPVFHIRSGSSAAIEFEGDGDMRFKSAGTSTKMSILTGGNVGIGTTTPSTALDVIGAIKNSSYIHQDADSSTTGIIMGAGGDANISYDGTNMRFNAARIGAGKEIHVTDIHASGASFQKSLGEVIYLRAVHAGFDSNAILQHAPNIQYVKAEQTSPPGAGAIPTELPLAESGKEGLEITVMQRWDADPEGALTVQKQTGSSDVIYEGGSNVASASVSIAAYRGANKTFVIAAVGVWVVKD